MPDMKFSSYFYGDEAMQFTYFRIPCQLITHPRFKHLSTDSKLLYGMLLDRMSLSIKNEWYDDTGRVYIYYTVDEVCSNLNCGRDKAMRLLAELDTGKGVGLIERKKQARASPPGYMSSVSPRRRCLPSLRRSRSLPRHLLASSLPTCRSRIFRPQDAAKIHLKKSRKPTLIKLKEINLILSSLIHPSIPQPPAGGKWGLIDAR